MSWKPNYNFDEEIIDLPSEPDNIFGGFLSDSEPQPFYPRPQSHIDYACSKQVNAKKQKEDIADNNVLHVISEVQKITGTKPWQELPTVNDWDTDQDVVAETIAMMRHFGLGPSLEGPLKENLTISTYPTDEKDLTVVRNGSRTFPVILNKKLFKLKPKDSSPYVDPADIIMPSYDESLSANSFTPTSSPKEHEPVEEINYEIHCEKEYLPQAGCLQEYPELNKDCNKKTKNGKQNNEIGKKKALKIKEPRLMHTSNDSKSSSPPQPKTSFLQRFMGADNNSNAKTKASNTVPSMKPITYASVAKTVDKKPAVKATTSHNSLEFSKLSLSTQTLKPSAHSLNAMKSSKAKRK